MTLLSNQVLNFSVERHGQGKKSSDYI